MADRTTNRGQAIILVILTAVIAAGLFLILKNSTSQRVLPSPEVTPVVSPEITNIVTPTTTVATDAQIDAQLKDLNDQSKNVDKSLKDTPIDITN